MLIATFFLLYFLLTLISSRLLIPKLTAFLLCVILVLKVSFACRFTRLASETALLIYKSVNAITFLLFTENRQIIYEPEGAATLTVISLTTLSLTVALITTSSAVALAGIVNLPVWSSKAQSVGSSSIDQVAPEIDLGV